MTKQNLTAVTTTFLNAAPSLIVLCSLIQALRPLLDEDALRAFFWGLTLGVSVALPAIALGTSSSEGEK